MIRAFKTADDREIEQLRKRIADLNSRLMAQQTAQENRLQQIESKVDAHEQRLNDVPSTTQIVAAMEELLSKTMTSLDVRLSSQAHSIEVLKTTVSQTDALLEKVLESIDRLKQAEDQPVFASSR